MTSGEIDVGNAAQALSKAEVNATKFDDPVNHQLQEISKDSPALMAAADSYAKRIAVKQEILLKLFKPLAKILGVAEFYFENGFAADMATKTADIPDENLRTPPSNVALPAMQGLAFSLDKPDLKDMYLNLLAAATNDRRTDQAHPSFSEIIKQLSPPEAVLLQSCLKQPPTPIIRIKGVMTEPGTGYFVFENHVLNWADSETHEPGEVPLGAMYLDNWIRLGLVVVMYDEYLTAPDKYDWVEGRPEFIRLKTEHASNAQFNVSFDKGILKPTAFGKKFSAATSV
jgi:hypothetical protein